MFFFSCDRTNKKTAPSLGSDYELKVAREVAYYKCEKEYDFVRLYLYANYFRYSCIGSICSKLDGSVYISPNGSRNLLTTNIRLDIDKSGSIKELGDTLVFRIFAFSNDSCKCHYGIQYNLPAGVSIIRRTKQIVGLHAYNGLTFYPSVNDVSETFKNPKMLKFAKKNKSTINKWFYTQLIVQGYIK
jgi:hypothetical protein